MMAKQISVALGALMVFAAAFGTANAHDPDPKKQNKAYVEFQAQRAKLLKAMETDKTRGVFSQSTLWPADVTKLTVCFMDGSNTIRKFVAKAAATWNDPKSSLQLDFGNLDKPRSCGKKPKSLIRVKFNLDEGYYSYVGVDSVRYAELTQPSVVLSGYDKFTDAEMNEQAAGIARHEFGHAIGLHHEHQNALGNCDNEFDWNEIYNYLESPPNSWSQEMVDHNMRTLAGDDYVTNKYDRKSIMFYTFPASYFKNGTSSRCYIPKEATNASPKDYATVEEMYPSDLNRRNQIYQDLQHGFKVAWEQTFPANSRLAPKMNLLKMYFPKAK
ncbi:MAG: hypothetical protein KGO94_05685 [Alphaproteobacteria bacterium]|nr:hypothetical protein [Alphaproteobacteria bacterium]